MNTRYLFVALSLLLFACADDTRDWDENKKRETVIQEENVLKGWVRVKLKEGAEPDELAAKLGTSAVERVFPDRGQFEQRMRKYGLHLWYDIYMDESIPISRAISDFSEMSGIEFAGPIRKIAYKKGESEQITPNPDIPNDPLPFNDPLLGTQWHYNNNGSLSDSKIGADVNLFRAWQIHTGHPDVIVAVVDGGIDCNHEDLKANMWTGKNGNHGWNFVDNSSTIIPHEHGTHVAGTIAAVNNNGVGVCGVAGGSGKGDGVRLMSCQIFKPDPANPQKDLATRRLPDAIVYGANNGAVISQNSWGFVYGADETPSMDPATEAAINYFIDNAGMDENGEQTGPMKGGIVIFSAGNEHDDLEYPAASENVISVAAMAPDFQKAYYSNYGSWVDLTAPGGSFRYNNKYSNRCAIASTSPDNRYVYMQGTSMACPHVSGIAALIVSKYGVGNPGFTSQDLKEMLLASVNDINIHNIDYRGELGSGYIDAGAALEHNNNIPPDPVTDLLVEWKAHRVLLSWSVTRDEDNGVPRYYNIYWSNAPLDELDPENLPPQVNSLQAEVGYAIAGTSMQASIPGLDTETSYYIAITGVDRYGLRSELTFANGMTTTNSPPTVARRTAEAIVLRAHETREVIFDVTDPDADEWRYTLSDPNGACSSEKTEHTIVVSIDALKIKKAGHYQASITIQDEEDATGGIDFSYEILENRSPLLRTVAPEKEIYFDAVGATALLQLSVFFMDNDEEELVFTVENPNKKILQTEMMGQVLQVKALKAGAGEFFVTATDALGDKVKSRFRTMARDATQEIDLYPNPVSDKLYIRMGKEVDGIANVKLYNSGGAKVLESRVAIHPFEPGVVDVSRLSGGTYLFVLEYAGREIRRNVMKR